MGRARAGRAGRPGHERHGDRRSGRRRGLEMFARWTDRIAAGDVPPAPPRPQGVERNLVLTMWDWGGPATFAHDELTTDKRNPTANAYGPIYGVDWGNDGFLIVDPLEHTAQELRIPVLDPKVPPGQGAVDAGAVAVLGRQAVLVRPGDHQSRRDGRQGPRVDVVAVPAAREPAGVLRHASVGRARAAEEQLPAGAVLRSEDAAVQAGQHLLRHAPRAVRATRTRRCTATASFSGAIGWINTRILDETGDEAAAQGWCRGYHDINQDGKVDPAVDRQISRERDLQRHPASERRQRVGRGARARCRARSSASIRRPALARRTSRRSIRRPASSATRRAASTSIRTA